MNKFLVKCTLLLDDKTKMAQIIFETENNRLSLSDIEEIILRVKSGCGERDVDVAVMFDLIYKLEV